MGKNLWKAMRDIVGLILVSFGILGLLIPAIHGLILLVAGIFLINPGLIKDARNVFRKWRAKRRNA